MRRYLLAGLGILCVFVAALGAILPGLPTTIFLIAACYLFARSFPWLEQRLVRNRFFATFNRYIDGKEKMPRKVKAVTLLTMWSFITVSCLILFYGGRVSPYVIALIPLAGCVGSYFIIFRR